MDKIPNSYDDVPFRSSQPYHAFFTEHISVRHCSYSTKVFLFFELM